MDNNLIQPNSIITITVQQTVSERIDKFLSEHIPQFSRSFFKRMVEEQRVLINDKIVQKPSVLLKEGDVVSVQFPAAPSETTSAQVVGDLGIKVLARTDHFLILSKPAPLLVHQPATAAGQPSVVDWLLAHFKELESVGYIERPGIVHRLDKDTSGLLIIARTNFAHNEFGRLFKDRHIHKTYWAVVQGHPEPEGTISYPIARSMSDRKKMAAFKTEPLGLKLRSATTHYKVLEYFKDSALLEVKPVTGRTHQIRVHCAAIGHPIIGDIVYGAKSKLINRQALHAHKLAFEFEGQNYEFTADLPTDFSDLLAQLRMQK
ncbi:pseudouridine synthase [Candidatus Dependentiae bacterium Noda2021]|nr:pseudouridine synthase [Candidatus Dependentiae bacterium Noda2021]